MGLVYTCETDLGFPGEQHRVPVVVMQSRMRDHGAPVEFSEAESPVQSHRAFVPLETDEADTRKGEVFGPLVHRLHHRHPDPRRFYRLMS